MTRKGRKALKFESHVRNEETAKELVMFNQAFNALPSHLEPYTHKYVDVIGRGVPSRTAACVLIAACACEASLGEINNGSIFGKLSSDHHIVSVLWELGFRVHLKNFDNSKGPPIISPRDLGPLEQIKRKDAHRSSAKLFTTTYKDQPVVLKIPSCLERFVCEVGAYVAMGDKYPVQILGIYIDEKKFGIVLPLLEPVGSLEEISPEKLLFDVKESLEIIHSCGLIHGDVKIPNIMMCNGKAVMIDFEHSVASDLPIEVLKHPFEYRPHSGEYPIMNYIMISYFQGIRQDRKKLPDPMDDFYALCKAIIHRNANFEDIGDKWEITAWRAELHQKVKLSGIKEYALAIFDLYHTKSGSKRITN